MLPRFFCCYTKALKVQIPEKSEWDCSVICAESSNNGYVVTEEKICFKTGKLSFYNPNTFKTIINITAAGKEEKTFTLSPYETGFAQVEKNIEHTIGCHADVKIKTEIKLTKKH